LLGWLGRPTRAGLHGYGGCGGLLQLGPAGLEIAGGLLRR
jgi:hypothetical protein